jgi:AraC-like DNA-binding protein
MTAGRPDAVFLPNPAATDRIVYQSELVCIGLFRCPVTAPYFDDTGPIRNHVMVFPRRAVRIEPDGDRGVVASPNVVMFYNRGQVYRRRPLDDFGDASDWFAFPPDVLLEAIGDAQAADGLDVEAPFPRTHGPSPAPEYLRQRRLVEHLLAQDHVDASRIDEACLGLLHRVLSAGYGASAAESRPQRARRAGTLHSHEEVVEAAKAALARRYRTGVTLAELARAVGTSPYHLARLFRDRTGSTVHRYLDQLRLRTALEALPETRDIGDLALQVGYSSHSHFTSAFRRAFGCTPSVFRAERGWRNRARS